MSKDKPTYQLLLRPKPNQLEVAATPPVITGWHDVTTIDGNHDCTVELKNGTKVTIHLDEHGNIGLNFA